MPRKLTTKGIAKSEAASSGPSTSSMVGTTTGTEGEIKLVSRLTRTWEEGKQARSNWDAKIARSEYQHAARTIGAPALLNGTRDMFLQHAAELTELQISFERQSTLYDWGNLLGLVNGTPFQHYFPTTETSAAIVESGSDPVAPAPYNVGGTQGVWGNVVLNVIDLGYSRRYGGSFCAVLAPSEDCAIELLDPAKDLAVDLHEWVLRLYVQPSLTVFNSGYTLPSPFMYSLMHCELNVVQSEAYKLGGLLPLPASVSQADIDALVAEGEAQAVPRLVKLARFMFGWAHYVNVPAFNRTFQTVDRIHVSDGMCRFDLSDKAPTIQVELNIGYLFSSEGIFDSERELTARPWLRLRTPPFLVLNSSKKRYIGNARNTGWMVMGYLAPDDFKTVHEIVVFPGWTESDPFWDDEGGSVATVMNIEPDDPLIDQRVAAQQPGIIGGELFAISNDPLVDWTTYSFQIRFMLTWR